MSKIILCADDSKTMRTVAEITFRASEYSYVGAQSADEALQKAHANKPALILADANMPGKTGYDLCKAVKTDPALADVPVVLLCGNSSPYDAEKGGDAGADGHVTKPWDTQVMLDKMDEILKKAGTAGIARPAGAAATPPVVPKPPILPATMGASKAKPEPASTPARTTTMMGMPMPSVPLPNKSNRPATAGSPPASASPPAASTQPSGQPSGQPPGQPSAPPAGQSPGQSIDMQNAKPLGAPLTSRQPGARSPTARPVTQPGGPGTGEAAPTPAGAAAPKGGRATSRGVPAAGRAASRAGVPAATPAPSLGAPTAIPNVPLPAAPKPAAPKPRAASAPVTRATATPAPAAPPASDESAGVRRPPMIRGTPRRGATAAPHRAASVAAPAGAARARAEVAARIERAVPAAAASAAQDAGIDPGGPEMKALMALSKDVIERIVWEVVPDLAETIIRENLDQLAKR